MHPQNGDIGGCEASFGAMTSHVVIEDSIIDKVLTLGRPDRRPAQEGNVEFFYYLNQLLDRNINMWKHLIALG